MLAAALQRDDVATMMALIDHRHTRRRPSNIFADACAARATACAIALIPPITHITNIEYTASYHVCKFDLVDVARACLAAGIGVVVVWLNAAMRARAHECIELFLGMWDGRGSDRIGLYNIMRGGESLLRRLVDAGYTPRYYHTWRIMCECSVEMVSDIITRFPMICRLVDIIDNQGYMTATKIRALAARHPEILYNPDLLAHWVLGLVNDELTSNAKRRMLWAVLRLVGYTPEE